MWLRDPLLYEDEIRSVEGPDARGRPPKEPPPTRRVSAVGDSQTILPSYDAGPLLNCMLPLTVISVSVGPPEPRVPCCWLGVPASGKSETITPLKGRPPA